MQYRALFAIWILVFCAQAGASVTYSYVGRNFDRPIIDQHPPVGTFTDAMKITGTFELSNSIPPNVTMFATSLVVSFSFFDGRNTISNSSADLLDTTFIFSTDTQGDLIAWRIGLIAGDPTLTFGNKRFFDISNFGDLIVDACECGTKRARIEFL